MSNSNKQKSSAKKQQLNCRYCDSPLSPDKRYVCHCGYELCWECFDDFYEDKEPYCPSCDAYLVSDSEDEARQSGNGSNGKSHRPSTNTQNTGTTSPGSGQSMNNPNGDLAKVRVIKKNLVYVIGLSPEIANEEMLTKKEYFSQYGKITKIVVNTSNAYNPKGPNGPSYSAYITYSNEREASMAILATEEFEMNGRTIRASYGTTKYCQFFLKSQECPNFSDCLYLHSFGKDKEYFSKEDTANKHVFIDQQKMAIKHIQKHLPDLQKIKSTPLTFTPVLPSQIAVIDRLLESEAIDFKAAAAATAAVPNQTTDKQQTISPSESKQTTPPKTQQQISTNVDCAKKKKIEDNTPYVDQWSLDLTPIIKQPKAAAVAVTAQSSSSSNNNSAVAKKMTITATTSATTTSSVSQTPQLQHSSTSTPSSSSHVPQQPIEKKAGTEVAAAGTLLVAPKARKESNDMTNNFIKANDNNLKSVTPPPPTNSLNPAVVFTPPAKSTQSNSTNLKATTAEQNKSTAQPQQQLPHRPASTPIDSQLPQSQPQTNMNSNSNGWIGIDNSKKKISITSTLSAPIPQQLNTNIASKNVTTVLPLAQTSSIGNATTSATVTGTTTTTAASTATQQSQKQQQNGAAVHEKKDPNKKEDLKVNQKHQYVPVSQINKVSAAAQATSVATPSATTQGIIPGSTTQEKQPMLSQGTQNVQQQQQQLPQTKQVNQQQAKSMQQQLQQQEGKKSDETNNNNNNNNSENEFVTKDGVFLPKYKLEKISRVEKKENSDNRIMKKLIMNSSVSVASRFQFARSEEYPNSNNSNTNHAANFGEQIDLLDHLFDGKYMNLIKPQVMMKKSAATNPTVTSNSNKNCSHSGLVH